MSFRLEPESVTLNDLERRNGPYFALFHGIFVYDIVVKQLRPNFQYKPRFQLKFFWLFWLRQPVDNMENHSGYTCADYSNFGLTNDSHDFYIFI